MTMMTVKVITRSLAVLHWCNQITRQGFIKTQLIRIIALETPKQTNLINSKISMERSKDKLFDNQTKRPLRDFDSRPSALNLR